MSQSNYVQQGGLQVCRCLSDLLEQRILPDTGLAPAAFWRSLELTIEAMGPLNRALLERRDQLQAQIDRWVRDNPAEILDAERHEAFLRSICYLEDEPEHCSVKPQNVDPEIAAIAGPQLVVPVDNARYALNATNARWGSLYDALYGTDVIAEESGLEKGPPYNPRRGAEVVARAMSFLDSTVPLDGVSFDDVDCFEIDGSLDRLRLRAVSNLGEEHYLRRPDAFRGFRQDAVGLSTLLLENNGLHIEISIDQTHPIGITHSAGICDIVLESAITTIQDCEDSVAAVDAWDKCRVYGNWHGLMQGTLEATLSKGGKDIVRRLNADHRYQGTNGRELVLHGRSLLLVRNVGMHMYTDAVLDARGSPIPEGILDAFVTVAAAIYNLAGKTALRNSRTGSIYIVKPKQHGPQEVTFTVDLFSRVEDALGLERNTIKLGIMDEERRTTLNLKACIAAAHERVIFINTGFLDRTGDEIHTLMEAGPVIPKHEIKQAGWMLAYEDWNVDTGLACGLSGRAQIGKGMWAMPDNMAAMVAQKIEHPEAGANTAWVPSPTAATLHAMHYHKVSVASRQRELADLPMRATLGDLLTPCLLGERRLSSEEINHELRNNAQSILGYVVRWIEQGIGCSKVPDINHVGLMEDRATLRISSQHIGNWLRHGLISEEEVAACFREMAVIVDQQNADDASYRPMADDFEASYAFQAALHLAVDASKQPNGYTEFILNEWRCKGQSTKLDMPASATEIARRRTFAIISHPDAGKTTLTEKLLLFGGAIQMAGAVKSKKAARHATSDWMKLEQERGISVTSSVMQFEYDNKIINLLDTPGHADFSEDTYRTLTAVDSALMVIDCAKGVEERTIRLMEVCRLRTTPIFTFINKLDREGRDPIDLLDEVESVLNIRCAPVTWPIGMGQRLRGVYHMLDDTIHLYESGRNYVTQKAEIIQGIGNPELDKRLGVDAAELRDEIELVRGASHKFDDEAYLAGDQTPVFFGSAINNFGVTPLLDAFVANAPAPGSRATVGRTVDSAEPKLTGFIFKIQANMDPAHRDRVAFMRICSGCFESGMNMHHVRLGKSVKAANALTFMAQEREHVRQAWPGDIVGLHNHGTISIGDTFTEGEKLQFTGIPNFAPELFRRAQLRDPLKLKALQKGLEQLSEEGATQYFRPMIGNELILGAVGILQFEVVAYRLKNEYKVDATFESTPTQTARWVRCEDCKMLSRFTAQLQNNLALDAARQLVYLAPSNVNLQLTIERWPEIEFAATRETTLFAD